MAATPETFEPLYKGRDFYVPAFDIKIQGQDISKATAKDVLDVRYTDGIDKIDTMELTINNWDAGTKDFKYTGSRKGGRDANCQLFEPGQVIELFMGYFKPLAVRQDHKDKSDPLRLMLAGKIHKLSPSFPASGQPVLKVSAQSILSQLSSKQETFHYEPKMFPEEKMQASLIAKKVSDRGKLKLGNLVVPLETKEGAQHTEPSLTYVIQKNQFDIVFLLQLAHRHGYDVVLKYHNEEKREEPYLFFGPVADEPRVSYSLEWGESLIQFQPTLTTSQQVSEVTVRWWDVAQKKDAKVTVDRTMLPNSPLRDKKQLAALEEGFKEKKEIIVDKPFTTKKEAEEYAKAQLSGIAGKMVTAHGSTLGTPDLRAGSRVEILGLGDTFTGTYTVTASTHSIGANGYITEFDARLEEKAR
ncbi:MAG: phage late control D family protein [Pyrinomonadaceae bacterium]|nr:phage late control D family protein [Pyrinomonadaceae bacterium]